MLHVKCCVESRYATLQRQPLFSSKQIISYLFVLFALTKNSAELMMHNFFEVDHN